MTLLPQSEQLFQDAVVEAATLYGWHHLHVRRSIGKGQRWVTATNLVGWPDLLLWRPDYIIAVELKSAGGKVTTAQRDVLDSLEAAGVETYVWRPDDWDEIQTTLDPRRWT